MNLLEKLEDLYFIGIKGLHKHNYQRIEDGVSAGTKWQRYECTNCEKTVGLDDWQIKNLPYSMKYEEFPQSEPTPSEL
ncbi:MAG: hypothetical protein KAS15_04780 [Nanoarchaeota archaeon]|nr:hypothetical protein [Nanoarchaeota archaeon]MCK5629322.1 hypothetical protein [Nanoarchaeota archaeon]